MLKACNVLDLTHWPCITSIEVCFAAWTNWHTEGAVQCRFLHTARQYCSTLNFARNQ